MTLNFFFNGLTKQLCLKKHSILYTNRWLYKKWYNKKETKPNKNMVAIIKQRANLSLYIYISPKV